MKEIKFNHNRKTLADYALTVETRDDFKHLAVSAEDMSKGKVGVEIEMKYSERARVRRIIYKYLKTKFKKEATTNLSRVRTWIAQHILNPFCIVATMPHGDGGGLECVLEPATFAAHKRLKEEYELLLEAYKTFGFNPIQGGDGIHTNIDYDLFGSIDDIEESMTLLMWFLYNNRDFMADLSKRKWEQDFRSDMQSMLGDALGNLSESKLLAVFKSRKGQMLEFLQGNSYESWSRYFNISFGRDGRRGIEFRWFGSTWDIGEFMMMIEFSFGIAEFIKQNRSEEAMTLSAFANFVRANIADYEHLAEEMFNNQFSTGLMTETFGPEQTEDDNIVQLEPAEVKTSRRIMVY